MNPRKGIQPDGLLYLLFNFLSVQDLFPTPPLSERCPNYKVGSLFCWIICIWKNLWVFSKNVCDDYYTWKMHVNSQYIFLCGKFNRIIDVIQCDYISYYGYTFDLYFINKYFLKWVDMGLSTMCARLFLCFRTFWVCT